MDGIDFPKHLPKYIEKCVTFDIINLYNNIPHDTRIGALIFWL